MSKRNIHFRRIGWRQTLEVIKLSRSLLPVELCRKPHSLLALFINLERRNHNLSFGLYCDEELVGYMLVYFHDRSLYHQRDELIVHIDEYCVMPDYRGRGRDVISRMVHEMELWQPRSGIEAIATGEALQHWLSIGRLVSRWGYETHLRENDCMRGGHQMGRIRWEFKDNEYWRPETPQKLPKAQAALEIDGANVELLVIRSTRQWLSLREAYSTLGASKAELFAGGFQYQWEFWRHFGVSEELCIVALRLAESIQMILPLSVKAGKSKSAPTLSLIGSNSPYGTAVPIFCSPESPKNVANLKNTMQQCLDHAGMHVDVDQICSAPIEKKRFIPPGGCLGFNRRRSELHKQFQQRVRSIPFVDQ